jgi:endonuclease/exonuclease/phosphatase family metal-dependent hydrolase
MLPLTVWCNRHLLPPLLLATLIVYGPVMGLNIPLSVIKKPAGPVLRVVTCNIHNGEFHPDLLDAFILNTGADIVALQECPDELSVKIPVGWHVMKDGLLAILSRYPLRDFNSLQALHLPHEWPRTSLFQCVVEAPGGDIIFNTVYLPSPRYGLQNVLDRHTLISPARAELLAEESDHRWRTAHAVQQRAVTLPLPVIIAGDFNMPIDSNVYRQVWGGYSNAFSDVGFGYGWTVWDTIRGIPVGVRVDHILVSAEFEALRCEIGSDIGSDHLPLVAEIQRSGG